MKRATACWAIAGLLVSLCTLFILRYGTTHGPAVLVDSRFVAEAADQVMACAASGDYKALEALLYGSPDLGEAPQTDGTAQGLIWKAYLDSIEYSFPGSCYAVDANMALDVRVSCLDISSVTDSLQEIAPGLMAKKAAQITDENEVYDEARNYREDFLAEVMAESAAQALEEQQPSMERIFTLQLVRSEGAWQVIPTEELLQFLSGFVSG